MDFTKKMITSLLGSAILAFGLYHIHSLGVVTEGGTLGMTLLLHHWFDLSPALSGFVLNLVCYGLGIKVLGKTFLLYSLVSGGGFSFFYALFEQTPLLWPSLTVYPLAAAVLGAVFVGLGVGLCVRCGGAPSGDDALAMTVSQSFSVPIERVYLITDFTVLALSLSYIPTQKILYSFLTVLLSGKIIGIIQKTSHCK